MPKRVTATSRRNTTKKASWKAVRNRHTLSHRLKLAGISILGILVAGVVFGGLSFAQFIKSPLSLASGSFPEGRVWNDVTPLNLVIIVTDDRLEEVKKLGIATFDKHQKSLSFVSVPTNVTVDYPLGLGAAPLSSAIILGDSLNPKIGLGLISKVILKNLALPIDRYALITESNLAKWTSNPADFKESLRFRNIGHYPQILTFIKENIVTNLSLTEMGDVLLFLKTVEPQKTNIAGFSGLGETLDSHWSDFYTRGLLKEKRVPVLILNATDREGLGLWAVRFIQNLGGDALTATNATGNYAKSFIITSDPSLPVVSLLGRTLNISTVYNTRDLPAQKEYSSSRAEVTLVLGLDQMSVL
ncbi:MAG: LytR C-terminal domain-containing protein [candidate division WWE3 bacterium]|nr:LytR C-terminal domain-containing protein [candidate division WWE3 bacterium]